MKMSRPRWARHVNIIDLIFTVEFIPPYYSPFTRDQFIVYTSDACAIAWVAVGTLLPCPTGGPFPAFTCRDRGWRSSLGFVGKMIIAEFLSCRWLQCIGVIILTLAIYHHRASLIAEPQTSRAEKLKCICLCEADLDSSSHRPAETLLALPSP